MTSEEEGESRVRGEESREESREKGERGAGVNAEQVKLMILALIGGTPRSIGIWGDFQTTEGHAALTFFGIAPVRAQFS